MQFSTSYELEHEKKANTGSFAGLDLVKFVMAIVVIAIHTHPFEDMVNEPLYYSILRRCAVPFFFLCTGFFIGKKLNSDSRIFQQKKIIGKYIKSYIRMYVLWNLIYLPLTIYYYTNIDVSNTLSHKILSFLKGFVLIGEQYNSWILWYLLSAIYALILVYFFIKKKSLFYFPVFALFAFVLSFVVNLLFEYQGVCQFGTFQKVIFLFLGSGRILTGCVYIPLGMFLASHRFLFIHILSLYFLGMIVFLFSPLPSHKFSTLLLSIAIFLTSLKINFDRSQLFCFLRKMSSGMYFVHLWIWTIVYRVLYGTKTYGVKIFLLTLFFSLLFTGLYQFFMMKKNDKV